MAGVEQVDFSIRKIALERFRTLAPDFLSLETDHKKSRGIDWSQSRRHTSFAPSKARKLPCSRKISRVDDSRIRVSTRICHSFRDRVWVWCSSATALSGSFSST